MPKQARSGRATLKYSIRLETLLLHALSDLGRYTDVGPLLAALAAEGPRTLYDLVSEELALADLLESDVQRYICLRQIHALLAKNEDLPGSSAERRRQAAMDSFLAAERRCKRANRRLQFYRKHWSRSPLAASILNDAAALIESCLPPVSEVYTEILAHCSFGPGVTYGSKSFEERSLVYKVSSHQTLTPAARSMFVDYVRANPRWVSDFPDVNIEYVRGDRVTFVPKNFKTFRTIAIQPSLNLFLQKGVEYVLTDVLRSVGVTLSTQERNGEAARVGSIYGNLATVDLSAASDSISCELVRWLFPGDWFSLLMALRTPCYTLDKGQTWTPLEKISAMGNAFTFPVESLIFWAITRAVMNYCGSNGTWRIYGDDIILPWNCYALLSEVFSFAGFSVNRDKSFVFGSFRESCGYDYVAGLNVRPVYIRRTPSSVSAVYNLYNRLLLVESGVTFPSTLRYLRDAVDRPHLGPISVARADVGFWEDMMNPFLDKYFISDPPAGEWDEGLQAQTWTVKVLGLRYKKLKGVSELIRYNLFLLGQSGPDVDDLAYPVRFDQVVMFNTWPRLRDVLGDDVRRVRLLRPRTGQLVSAADLNCLQSKLIYSKAGSPRFCLRREG